MDQLIEQAHFRVSDQLIVHENCTIAWGKINYLGTWDCLEVCDHLLRRKETVSDRDLDNQFFYPINLKSIIV